MKRQINRPITIALVLGTILAGAVAADYFTALPKNLPDSMAATFVGRDACVNCHQSETAAFHGSHHDKAMDIATDETVIGDFDDATIEHDGITSRMFRRDDAFMINTEGPTGQMEDFEIKYVFGFEPLQQYMVEMDRDPDLPENEIGRVQVLRISWDCKGKKWFYLRPPDVAEKLEPGDPLHWTGIAQRWQTMCAVCHSTNLDEGFNVADNKYHTTFSEIDVSCEACHGPGSLHIELANSRSLFWDRHHGYGLAKLKGDSVEPQLQTCAPCHSRRAELTGNFQPGKQFCNHYQLETMTPATYYADGQIKDEVYVYGSFIQSKMYHQGIRCTDCHDPHSLERIHPGNETCTSCHQHTAGKYDVPSHHHHAVGTEGAKCVNCHMPHTTYMGVDPRRDHSLRVPRPDLSVKLSTPNACSHCHVSDQLDSLPPQTKELLQDKEYSAWLLLRDQGNEAVEQAIAKADQWCDDACEKWYGKDRKTPMQFAEMITAFRQGEPGSVNGMLKLATSKSTDPINAAAIARASILRELAESGTDLSAAAKSISRVASDPAEDAMVRAAAIVAMGNTDANSIRSVLIPLLKDESTLVRIEAARTIIGRGLYRSLTGTEVLQLDPVLDRDVMQSLSLTADRSGSHMARALIEEQRGNFSKAIEAYQSAIRVEPVATGPRTNLAALLENLASDESIAPTKSAEMLAKAKELREQELPLLARDAVLAPNSAELQNRYGLALYLSGDDDKALEQLKRATELAPDVVPFRQAYELLKQKMAE
jgi:tetratricopeptide (TPR) repeat protein